MIRMPDWEQRLAAYLDPLMADAAFEWGRRDCALFAADAVLTMTGEDIAAAFRGRYTTAHGSLRALKRYGAGDLRSTFSATLPSVPVGYARRGDLVMHDGSIGICIGSDALFLRLESEGPGLERISRAEWSDAWSVG